MKSVRVFAPATIANLGCGFDIMGLALDEAGDVLEMTASAGDGLCITNESGVPLPGDPEANVITPVVRKFFIMTGLAGHVDVTVRRKIYPGSGIGSSAASCAAAAFGMNELFGRPLGATQLVECAMEGELLASGGRHADNVAPALLGGIVLIRGYEPLDLVRLPVPEGFYCTVVHPQIVVSTKEAREILPKAVPMHDAVAQWGNVGGLVAGLYTGDVALVGRAMKDSVAEPYRKRFIPGFDVLREELLAAGALAMNISGSGPSVFALSDKRETAVAAGEIMKSHFASMGVGCSIYVEKVSATGAKLLSE
ncbi:MAG: homoserine kinase [Bacteroidales bacterium]|nr:homoserine kinase [Bacteroidales bacterium]